MAKRAAASAGAWEESTAPWTSLLPPTSKGNGGARSADTPDTEDHQNESVADGKFRGSNDDIPCSRLPSHVFSDEAEKRSFRMITDSLAANQILVTRLCGPDNSGAGSADAPGNVELEDGSVTDWPPQGGSEDMPCSR